jgi:hypothetical protein
VYVSLSGLLFLPSFYAAAVATQQLLAQSIKSNCW